MKTRVLSAALTLMLVTPLAVAAQNPVTESLHSLFTTTKTNIMATAEMLDEDLYAFRPTDEVRSVGEMLAHIANAQYLFCSSAAGEDSPATENFEQTRTSKAAIIEALEMGFGYCEGVFENMTDTSGHTERTFFGGPQTAFGVLAFNSMHNYEHYGNLVTYMRMNGIVPPSSM